MNLYSYAKIPWITGRLMRKTILVMKLIFFIITIACVQVSAIGYAQKVNIQQKDVTLTTIFSTIEKQTGYSFFWKNEDLTKIKIDVKLENASLEDALQEVFKGLPLTYSILKKSIVVQAKAPSFLEKVVAAFDGIDVKGAVLDREGRPLPGATVTIKGERRSTTTNVKGEFSLANVSKDAVLQISYMGYVTKDVAVSTNYVGVLLELSTSKLDEVQVMAYGTTNRRLATANIGTVTAKDIEKQPVMNPLLALSGRVAGVTVTPTSGYASGTIKVEIRGRNAIDSKFTSEPLYIIDGVPLTYLEIGGTSNYEQGSSGIVQNGMYVPGGGQSPLFNISPADIESIDILKDGDATAIYGSRGANGVVLITTKKGKPGATTVTADISHGISKITRYWDMLNTEEYIKMRKQAFKNDGITPTVLNAPDLMVWDTTRYTNWQKVIWGNNGSFDRVGTTISGGNDNTIFRISSNFTRQTEIITASGANKVAGISFTLSNTSMDKKFRTNLSANYSYSDVNNVSLPSVERLAPNAPPMYNAAGELNFEEWNDAGIGWEYPFAQIKSVTRSQNKFFMGNLELSYQILKGLDASTTFGYNTSHNIADAFSPISAQNPVSNPTGLAIVGTNDNENWMIEPKLNYQTTISKGRFTALLGATLQSTGTDGQSILGTGFTDDNFLKSMQYAPVTKITVTNGRYKYAALSGRIGYSWDDKYIVNISGRRDGSSRFGKGKQYGNFGALAFAWIASQESWFKSVVPAAISFLKFRGSYAITGSDNIGDYQYLTEWANVSPNGGFIPNYGGATPLASGHAVNPDYQWQVNKKLEVGMSISFLQDRFNLEANYYRNRCGNQLTKYPTPLFSGFNDVTGNWPASLQNSGWEVMTNARVMKTNNFNWSVNFNISGNSNILLAYPDIENSAYFTTYIVGKPLNVQYLLHFTGVDPLTGQYSFEDHNRNGAIHIFSSERPNTGNDDRYILLNLDPKFMAGFGTEFSYKNIQLSLFFQYKNQIGRDPSFLSEVPGSRVNIPRSIYNKQWENPGQQADYARFTTRPLGSDAFINGSDMGFRDASYLRLNNVALSYTLPETILKGKRKLNVFAQAQNLFVITKYNGIDPDSQSFGSMPPAKIITAGLSLTL
jgi:TonB-linked SusC/RagA family outer membrane protein